MEFRGVKQMGKRKIKPEERPVCSCGQPMKLVHYIGYYDEDLSWYCDNDDCPLDLDELEPDSSFRGQYA